MKLFYRSFNFIISTTDFHRIVRTLIIQDIQTSIFVLNDNRAKTNVISHVYRNHLQTLAW